MKKIIITGCNGQLGRAMNKVLDGNSGYSACPRAGPHIGRSQGPSGQKAPDGWGCPPAR